MGMMHLCGSSSEGGGIMAMKQTKATAARRDPYRNFRFRLEIDGIAAAGFSEAMIGETVTEAIDYREGNELNHVRKLPGLHKFGNVTLKRGMTASLEIFQWHKLILDGATANARRNVAVIIADESGADQARFTIRGAWPVKYAVSNLNGKGNEVLIETLELANEGIERVA
jgi:phage tail-like protein